MKGVVLGLACGFEFPAAGRLVKIDLGANCNNLYTTQNVVGGSPGLLHL